MRAVSPWLALVLLTGAVLFPGCVGLDDKDDVAPQLSTLKVRVVDAKGSDIPFFTVALLDAEWTPLAYASTGVNGTAYLPVLDGADAIGWGDGNRSYAQGPLQSSMKIVVSNATSFVPDAAADKDPVFGLKVNKMVELGSKAFLYSANAGSCRDTQRLDTVLSATHDCGLSEPTIEIDNDGVIYASGVCCVGGAPPVWVSRNDGHHWETLGTPFGQREAFGIEGDFAIDDAGNMYFFDIELGAVQVSAWTSQGTHIHTTHWPGIPLVDRPWIRAEGDGTIYLIYNQGVGSSTLLKSTDHGRTYEQPDTFPYNFGNIARGVSAGHILMATSGPDATIVTYETTDGAATWIGPTSVPAHAAIVTFVVPLVDDAGNRYLVYDARPGEKEPGYVDDGKTGVFVISSPPDGEWGAPVAVSPRAGTHTMPWGATAADGALALAWYGTLGWDEDEGTIAADEPWYLFVAATLDATSAQPTYQTIIADAAPVLKGPIDRRLLDFLQVDIGPDGAIHVAYAHILPDAPTQTSTSETTAYLQTLANLPLVGADGLRNGPH